MDQHPIQEGGGDNAPNRFMQKLELTPTGMGQLGLKGFNYLSLLTDLLLF